MLFTVSKHRFERFLTVFFFAERHIPVFFFGFTDHKIGNGKMVMYFKIKRIRKLPHQHGHDVGITVFIGGSIDPRLQLVPVFNRQFFHSFNLVFLYYIQGVADYKQDASLSKFGLEAPLAIKPLTMRASSATGICMPSFSHCSRIAMHPALINV